MQDAVQPGAEGVLIKLHVTPGASKTAFGGYDSWRKCIKVSVKGQPRKGEANAEVVKFLSRQFGIPESNIKIVSGIRDRLKTLSLKGLETEGVLKMLRDGGMG